MQSGGNKQSGIYNRETVEFNMDEPRKIQPLFGSVQKSSLPPIASEAIHIEALQAYN